MKNTTISVILIIFSCVYLIPLPTEAQIGPSGNSRFFRVGLRAGGSSVLPLEVVPNATYHPTVSYHGGVFVNIGRNRLSFQPELNLSQRRVWADYNQQGVILAARVATNRVEMPLLVKATFGSESRAKPRFFINAGPYGAYVLNERYNANVLSYGGLSASLRSVIDAVVVSLDNKKAIFDGNKGRFSYGIAGGLGVAFRAGPGQLTIEGRALYQLGDNTGANATDPSGTGLAANIRDTKYALMQASIGYLIPIGGH
jgi:hypothetical protein